MWTRHMQVGVSKESERASEHGKNTLIVALPSLWFSSVSTISAQVLLGEPQTGTTSQGGFKTTGAHVVKTTLFACDAFKGSGSRCGQNGLKLLQDRLTYDWLVCVAHTMMKQPHLDIDWELECEFQQQLLPRDLCFLFVYKFDLVWSIVDLTTTIQSSS